MAAKRRSRVLAPIRVLAATNTPIGISTPSAASRYTSRRLKVLPLDGCDGSGVSQLVTRVASPRRAAGMPTIATSSVGSCRTARPSVPSMRPGNRSR